MVGTLCDGVLMTEEIHRFPNKPVRVLGTLYWDVLALYGNIVEGMRIYGRKYGSSVASIGIDTWGVDFGLLAHDGTLLENPVCYRDQRTDGILAEVERRVRLPDLFRRTGRVLSPIQTLCQMAAMRRAGSPTLEKAATFLMMPDLFAYFLTGVKACERTNATTTQIFDPTKRRWSETILQTIEMPQAFMPELVDPGTMLGEVLSTVAYDVGLRPCPVIAPCTHDTASAVAAVPGIGKDWAFLSSGTWSILGALSDELVTSDSAFQSGMCNELTLGSPFLCKNILGLGLLQQARACWEKTGQDYSYQELVELARQAPENCALIDPGDICFLSTPDMNQTICDYSKRTGQRPPQDPARVARSILESLALCNRHWLHKLEEMLGRRFRVLHIVGGGSSNTLLCQYTADATGIPVLAGPREAAVAGNLLVQALTCGRLESAESIRQVVRRSSQMVEYRPGDTAVWDDRYEVYRRILGAARVPR